MFNTPFKVSERSKSHESTSQEMHQKNHVCFCSFSSWAWRSCCAAESAVRQDNTKEMVSKKDLPPSVSSCSDIAILSPMDTLSQLHTDLTGRLDVPLPLSDISHVQTVRLRGTRRGGDACLHHFLWVCTSVCVSASVCACSCAHVQMGAMYHFHSIVNRKLSGVNICQSSDNSIPVTRPSTWSETLIWGQGCVGETVELPGLSWFHLQNESYSLIRVTLVNQCFLRCSPNRNENITTPVFSPRVKPQLLFRSSYTFIILSQTHCKHISSTARPVAIFGSCTSSQFFHQRSLSGAYDTLLYVIAGSNGLTQIQVCDSALIKEPLSGEMSSFESSSLWVSLPDTVVQFWCFWARSFRQFFSVCAFLCQLCTNK